VQRVNFRMGFSRARMESFADYLIIVHHYASNARVRMASEQAMASKP
jgi:hypothetical protein